VDALEAVLVGVGGLAAVADEGAVVELPLVGLQHPAGEVARLWRARISSQRIAWTCL
jgi:hypothetical protein